MAVAPEHTPVRIAQHDAQTLAIDWADGVRSLYDVRALRLACACAECVDEWSGEARLAPTGVPADVAPRGIHSVGRYAIQIDWSDGHSTGIYPFARLRSLATRDGTVGAAEGATVTPLPVVGAPSRAPVTASTAIAAEAAAHGAPTTVAPARAAATILLVRDGRAGLEVFMVERHQRVDFAEGALVFPGGKTEAADCDPALADYLPASPLLDPVARSLRAAAIRETFEECGVLLARPRGSRRLVDAARMRDLAARHRTALQRDERSLLEVVRAEGLELAVDLLVPFAHWITPEFMPKRFDTHFFLVAAPIDQLPEHDGTESVDSLWTSVPAALELERTGRRTIIFPTLENLRKLGRSRSAAEALERARREPIVTVLPRLEVDEHGHRLLVLPPDSGYENLRAPIEALSGGAPRPADGEAK